MDTFLSDPFFKSFSSKYVYVEAATTMVAPSLVLSPVTLYHIRYMFSQRKCDQLFLINGYICTQYICFLTMRRSKHSSSKCIYIFIIRMLNNITVQHCQFNKCNYTGCGGGEGGGGV